MQEGGWVWPLTLFSINSKKFQEEKSDLYHFALDWCIEQI